jgi:hypothetical protein
LGQRSYGALSQLDFAGEARDSSVFTYPKIGIEIRTFSSAASLPVRRRVAYGEEDYDSTTYALQKLSTAQWVEIFVTAAFGDLQFILVHLYLAPFIS